MQRLRFLCLVFASTLLFATSFAKPTAEPAPAAEIYDVKDLDTAPKVLKQKGAAHPRQLLGTGGKAMLRFTIDTQGRPRDIEVLSATHKAFGDAGIDSIKQWRFKPGTKNGQPVPTRMQCPFTFHSAG